MAFKSNPLVSVIIPTFNRCWGLLPAIESARAQTWGEIEILVVDDCSTDATAPAVNQIVDTRLTYFRQPSNVGMVANWGEGLRRAAGEYVVFLADDDRLGPEFVSNRLQSFGEGIDLVFSGYEICDREGVVIGNHDLGLSGTKNLEPEELLQAALSRQWFIGATMYARSSITPVWNKVAHDDLVLDFGLNIRLCTYGNGRGRAIDVRDFTMMRHPEQNSQAKAASVYAQTSDVLLRILVEGVPDNMRAPIRRELASWCVMWGRHLAGTGCLKEARRQLLRSVLVCPSNAWAWRQLALACLSPRRIIAQAAVAR